MFSGAQEPTPRTRWTHSELGFQMGPLEFNLPDMGEGIAEAEMPSTSRL
jgi:hypothetical protein